MHWCQHRSWSKKEKTFWIIVAIGLLVALIYEWMIIISDLVQTPRRSRLTYKTDLEELRLPNMLICPVDPVNYTAINNAGGQQDSSLAMYLQSYMFPHLVRKPSSVIAQWQLNQSSQAFDNLLRQYSGQKAKLMTDFFMRCDGIASACSIGNAPLTSSSVWGGFMDCCQNSTQKLTPVGPCMFMQLPSQTIPGYDGRYQIDLNVRQADLRAQSVGNFGGFTIFLSENPHRPLSTPSFIMPDNGMSYEVKLTPRFFRQTDTRYCDKNLAQKFMDSDYPYQAQLMSCMSSVISVECRCYPYQHVMVEPRDDSLICQGETSLTCSNRTLTIFNDGKFNSEKMLNDRYYRTNGICDRIWPPCDWSKYDISLTVSKIMATTGGTTSNINTASNFINRLILYYDDFDALYIDQYYAPNYHDVIIQVGGALTFWFFVLVIIILATDAIKCLMGVETTARVDPRDNEGGIGGSSIEANGHPTKRHHVNQAQQPAPAAFIEQHQPPVPPQQQMQQQIVQQPLQQPMMPMVPSFDPNHPMMVHPGQQQQYYQQHMMPQYHHLTPMMLQHSQSQQHIPALGPDMMVPRPVAAPNQLPPIHHIEHHEEQQLQQQQQPQQVQE